MAYRPLADEVQGDRPVFYLLVEPKKTGEVVESTS